MTNLIVVEIIAGFAFIPPSIVFVWLAFLILVDKKPAERTVVRYCRMAIGLAFVSAFSLAVLRPLGLENSIVLGSWFRTEDFHYDIVMQTDLLAVCYAMFSTLLLYLISSFSQRYLHREPGFYRFYLVLLLFTIGLLVVSYSGTLELLVVGWEIVGISSVMLIAFFNQRPLPPQNGLWVFSIYRITDIGLYAAVLYLHSTGVNTLFLTQESVVWSGTADHTNFELTALLMVFAVMGKAALFPFCSWLPRAMEGPTPSSAVFYGALSVHLGPFLLLRLADLIEDSSFLGTLLIVIGLLTVIVGNLSGRVQTDIKSRLSFGSVSQLGFIVMEIGLGWFELALVHVITHAVFRTLQFLRAPSLLHERHHLEQMLGHHVAQQDTTTTNKSKFELFLYRFGLERGFLDTILVDWFLGGIMSMARIFDAMEMKFGDLVAGESSGTQLIQTKEIEDSLQVSED